MVFILLISLLLIIFASVCKQTPYEKQLSDIQQEYFIKEYQNKKKSSL